MNECPVCRAPLFGDPERCDECGTPIYSLVFSNTSWARILTLMLPGLGHLWLGRLWYGVVVSFFSCLSLSILFQLTTEGYVFVRAIAGWVLFWIPWVGGWFYHVKRCRRRFVGAESLATTVTLLLIVGNILVVVTNFLLLMGLNYG
jgi:hypothetical protein